MHRRSKIEAEIGFKTTVGLGPRLLSTEIEFGLMLIRMGHIEFACGDYLNATRALSEASAVHKLTSSIIHTQSGRPALKRKLADFGQRLSSLQQKVDVWQREAFANTSLSSEASSKAPFLQDRGEQALAATSAI
jgi:hypothetical protein